MNTDTRESGRESGVKFLLFLILDEMPPPATSVAKVAPRNKEAIEYGQRAA